MGLHTGRVRLLPGGLKSCLALSVRFVFLVFLLQGML
jgi:hypothetical protein